MLSSKKQVVALGEYFRLKQNELGYNADYYPPNM